MALIVCAECGKNFSDKANACPNCGCPIDYAKGGLHKHTITFTMAKQTFLISTVSSIYLNGDLVASVGDGQSSTFKCNPGQNTILIKAGFKKKELIKDIHSDLTLIGKWNRLTGSLDISCVQTQ